MDYGLCWFDWYRRWRAPRHHNPRSSLHGALSQRTMWGLLLLMVTRVASPPVSQISIIRNRSMKCCLPHSPSTAFLPFPVCARLSNACFFCSYSFHFICFICTLFLSWCVFFHKLHFFLLTSLVFNIFCLFLCRKRKAQTCHLLQHRLMSLQRHRLSGYPSSDFQFHY